MVISAANKLTTKVLRKLKRTTNKKGKPVKTNILLSLILAGSLSVAHAAEEQQTSNTSTAKAADLQKKDEQVKDIDDEITNAKMRAESGSKSKWSASIDMSYFGGNLSIPFGDVRPNYSGEAATNAVTSFEGTVGVSYRIDPKNRLSLNTGVAIYTPFQARAEDLSTSSENGGLTDVSTPSIVWGHATKIGSTQNSFSLGYSHATTNYDVNTLKQIGAASLSHVIIFNIEGSNFQPGIASSLSNSFYKDGANESDRVRARGRRPDYVVSVAPFVEYAFNDTYSLRTVFRPATFSHMRKDAADTFEKSMYTQSLGLGMAITRDIFLYPNMQFAPENFRADLTNVGLATTINMF